MTEYVIEACGSPVGVAGRCESVPTARYVVRRDGLPISYCRSRKDAELTVGWLKAADSTGNVNP
jgi:hypothetical protein